MDHSTPTLPSTPSRAQRRGTRHHRWRRDTVELAAVFLAVASADLVANVVVHGHDGPVLLAASAAALLATALFHSWWAHRHPHGLPSPDTPAPPGDAAVTGPLDEFEAAALWRIRTTVEDSPAAWAGSARRWPGRA